MMEAVIFIGIQAAGKSTFYQENFFKTHIRINLDMLKTRHRESILLDACIRGKQPFVVDNTNPTVEDRKRYITIVKNAGFTVTGYYFHSCIQESIRRNESRTGREAVPVPGIKSTYAKLQLPRQEEGFDALYFVRTGHDSSNHNKIFIVQEWKHEIQ
ncbi:AAA family ATPase [Acetonema longum]|nr:AAA family ATPase [Acetonema longum]